MKIIIAPSKTQNENIDKEGKWTAPLFLSKAEEIVDTVSRFDKEKFSRYLKVKGKLLESAYKQYSNFNRSTLYPAIYCYSGEVFKKLNLHVYTNDENEYMQSHLVILSALYGPLKPFDHIRMYRLDMKMKVFEDKNLYSFWSEEIESYFQDEEVIVNLASDEFSSLVKKEMTNVIFKEKKKENEFKIVGIYSKQARGKLLNFMIENKIENIERLKDFSEDGYQFNEVLSSKKNLVFTR